MSLTQSRFISILNIVTRTKHKQKEIKEAVLRLRCAAPPPTATQGEIQHYHDLVNLTIDIALENTTMSDEDMMNYATELGHFKRFKERNEKAAHRQRERREQQRRWSE